jgi:hypothetical protein
VGVGVEPLDQPTGLLDQQVGCHEPVGAVRPEPVEPLPAEALHLHVEVLLALAQRRPTSGGGGVEVGSAAPDHLRATTGALDRDLEG